MSDHSLAHRILDGDRRALARAITLIESRRKDHRVQALSLIADLGQANRQALRIGLSGTPGVGKSTFVEAFGLMLLAQGLRVARHRDVRSGRAGEGLCGGAAGGLAQGHRWLGARGAGDVRDGPVLWGGLRLPRKTGGQDQAAAPGSDRHGAGSQAARGRQIRLARGA